MAQLNIDIHKREKESNHIKWEHLRRQRRPASGSISAETPATPSTLLPAIMSASSVAAADFGATCLIIRLIGGSEMEKKRRNKQKEKKEI